MIWRRLWVRSDSTIADLHHSLQIVMNWADGHLHHFLIRGKRYGIEHSGAFGFMDDASQVRLDRFDFRPKEKFSYTYNYYDDWQLEIRFEARRPLEVKKSYPVCMAGKRAAPPEDCEGPWRFMALRQKYSLWDVGERLLEILDDENLVQNRESYVEEINTYLYWLSVERFDRRGVNQRLQKFFQGE